MTHQKPTKEQLEADIKKAQEEIDALDKPEKIDPPIEHEDPKEDNDDEDQQEDDAEDGSNADGEKGERADDDEEESDEEVPGKDKPEEKPALDDKEQKEVDWKERYAQSTREALLIKSKNDKLAQAYDKAQALPEPTEAELTQEFPDWENLSEFERKVAKKTLLNDRRFALIEGVRQEFKDVEAHNKKVDAFIEDPKTLIKYPDLEGKAEAFKVFAAKPNRQGVEFADLVSSFLYKVSQERVKHKGKMFEDGDGGSKERRMPKSTKLTLDQAAVLRKTNYKEYVKQLRSGNIEDEVI